MGPVVTEVAVVKIVSQVVCDNVGLGTKAVCLFNSGRDTKGGSCVGVSGVRLRSELGNSVFW